MRQMVWIFGLPYKRGVVFSKKDTEIVL